MKSRFQHIYNLVMESVESFRKPIVKLDQMNDKAFVAFLKNTLPYIKDRNLNKGVRITEKIDGQAFRILVYDGDMKFGSSYTDNVDPEKVPMTEAAMFIKEHFYEKFQELRKELGFDFKLIGELIWIAEPEESGKVTPVCASYRISNFGEHGGMVVFDIKKIEADELVDLDAAEEDNAFDKVSKIGDEAFSYYIASNIDITDDVYAKMTVFFTNVDELLAELSQPEYDAARLSPATKSKVQQMRSEIVAKFADILRQSKGAFSDEGDLKEGMVIRINDTGDQYGLFSDNYKEVKHGYWNKFDVLDRMYGEFFKSVFGCIQTLKKKKVIPVLEQDPQFFKAAYDQIQPEYQKKAEAAYQALIDDATIPKNAKRVQVSMGKNIVSKLSVADYDTFIKRYVTYTEGA